MSDGLRHRRLEEMNRMGSLLLAVTAAVSGFAITLQGQFMGLLDRALGTKEGVFVTYAGGGALVILIALLTGLGNLLPAARPPWYAYTSGALGLIIVGTIGFVVPRLGAARAFTLILASQFLLAAVIDHFGFLGALQRPLGPGQLAGMGLVLAGVWLVIR
jgi:bacterial/archaeal transporter family-2 protein